MYAEGEYDLAGCIVGIVGRSKIVDGSCVENGDILLGLASAGLHTNGYSLARRVLLEDAELPLGTHLDDVGATLADALLWQHRCYLPAIAPLLAGDAIHAMAHITGGGLTDNVPRTLPEGLGVEIVRSSWETPPLFALIQRAGDIPESEMLHAFNMGIGYVVIVSPTDSQSVIGQLTSAGETVYEIGRVVQGAGVTYV